MAKRCTRCGNFLMDDERFCTRCGENVSNVLPEGAAAPYMNAQPVQPAQNSAFGANPGYTSQNAQNGAYYNQQAPSQQYTYAQPAQSASSGDEMSLGKWVLTIIVTTFFGIISLIFLFIWGFGDGPESRKNYCKAMLIVELISIALSIVLMIAFFGIIGASLSSLGSEFEDWAREYGQYTVSMLSTLFAR